MTTWPSKPTSRYVLVFCAVLLLIGLGFGLYTYQTRKVPSQDEFVHLTNAGKNYFDKGEADKAVAVLARERSPMTICQDPF